MIGFNQEHILAQADIYRTPDKVLIQITAVGENGQLLAEFLEQAEPIGLSFGPIPVQNISKNREKN
jgi:hypothetical protein